MKGVFEMEGRDIPLTQLKPVHLRDINFSKNPGFRKIIASVSPDFPDSLHKSMLVTYNLAP